MPLGLISFLVCLVPVWFIYRKALRRGRPAYRWAWMGFFSVVGAHIFVLAATVVTMTVLTIWFQVPITKIKRFVASNIVFVYLATMLMSLIFTGILFRRVSKPIKDNADYVPPPPPPPDFGGLG